MEVRVNHLGEVQFEVTARDHRVFCDQPTEAGGFDEGMTPPEFFLASIGACAGYYIAEYIRNRKLQADGLNIRVTAEKLKGPARLDDIRILIDYPHDVEPRHRQGMLDAVHKCLIHNTLLRPPKITTEFAGAGEPAALAA